MRWSDGSYSVQGVASLLGVTPQVIFDYLGRGFLVGRQRSKDSLGKSIRRTIRSGICRIVYNASDDQKRWHHEIFASPNTLPHSANPRLEVRIMAPFS